MSGLNITEVAHDYSTSVSDYIINDLHLLNLYDTWHGMSSSYTYPIVVRAALVTCEGTKNVVKAMKRLPRVQPNGKEPDGSEIYPTSVSIYSLSLSLQ